MEQTQSKAALEAVLFAYADPVSTAHLAEVLELDEATVRDLLDELQQALAAESRGLVLLQLEDRWQLSTKTEYGDVIKRALDTRRNTPLSPAAMETLAVIAYNQPVSRSFIEQVRGVDSSSPVQTLLQKCLIEEAGRLDLPGRPVAFRTTDVFLRTFGISSLAQLPALHDDDYGQVSMDEAAAEAQGEAGEEADVETAERPEKPEFAEPVTPAEAQALMKAMEDSLMKEMETAGEE